MNLYAVQDTQNLGTVAVVAAENGADALAVIEEAKMPPAIGAPEIALLDMKLFKRVKRQVLWARWLP